MLPIFPPNGFEVVSDKLTVRARKIVVTGSAPAVSAISFTPPLGANQAQLFQTNFWKFVGNVGGNE